MKFDRAAGGARLRTFVKGRKGKRTMDELGRAAGLRGRQTLNEWFSGETDFYVGSLQGLADALGVRRVDLIAAYDGVTPPDTTKEPPPEWAEALMTRDEVAALVEAIQGEVTKEIRANREAIVAALAQRVTRQTLADSGPLLQRIHDVLARVERRLEE